MAPTKRKSQEDQQQPQAVNPQPNTAPSGRVTRAASKRASAGSVAELPEKKTKKTKGAAKEPVNDSKEGTQTEKGEAEKKAEGDSGNVEDALQKKTIVIEHCKQCTSFKKTATLVKEGLEKRVSGITVIVNPEKPRRGCFEVREEGGKKFISLLDMKRPFTPMKELEMDKVISDIIGKSKIFENDGESIQAQIEKGKEENAKRDLGNTGDVLSQKKTITIEHCKQCNSFKKRATLVKEVLENRVSGITVIVNPEKPRRGCFEVREGGKKFISLLDMKRPFTPMKELDMDKVISDIIDEISSSS